jgi:hypothetical protein
MTFGMKDRHQARNWILARVDYAGDDCQIWPFTLTSAGYGIFGYLSKIYKAHRYMCELVHGKQPTPTHQAAHECGDTRCVNPRHLSWKTASENQHDRKRHGTQIVRRRKLTAEQADEIRALYLKEDPRLTASRYGVTEANVRLIQYGKTWRVDRPKQRVLSDDEVRAIRAQRRKVFAKDLAKQYGVGKNTILKVQSREFYRYVTDSPA